MFYPLFSRLVPPQPLQNASHHIRKYQETNHSGADLTTAFFFALAKILVYVHRFQTYILAENVKMMGCHWKHLEVLPYCLVNILTDSQRTERRKALTSYCSNRTPATLKHIRKFFVSCLIRAHTHFTVTHQDSCSLRCCNSQKQRKEVHT